MRMYILPFFIIAFCKYTSTAGDDGKLVMGSFFNKQGIRIRTYASRVDNPKGHIIMIHGIRAHFRSVFCSYNLEWYAKNVTEYIRSDAETILDKELKDILPDLTSLKKDGTVHEDLLHGMNAFDTTPRFLYEGTFVQLFNKLGYSVYGLDLQSHGLSGGISKQRCYFHKFDDFVYDVMQFVSIVKRGKFDDLNETWDEQLVHNDKRHDNLPYHLIGLSLGGNVILKAQLLFDSNTKGQGKFIDGMICMSSMLNLDTYRIPLYKFCYPFVKLYSIIFPKRTVIFESMDGYANGIDLCMRFNDPLHYAKKLPSRTMMLSYASIYDLRNNMRNYPKDLPTLFIHSEDDSYCSVEGPRKYMKKFFKDSEIVELYELEGKTHVVTMPTHVPIMEQVLKRWLNSLEEM